MGADRAVGGWDVFWGGEDFRFWLVLVFVSGGGLEEFAESVDCCWGEEGGCYPDSFVG